MAQLIVRLLCLPLAALLLLSSCAQNQVVTPASDHSKHLRLAVAPYQDALIPILGQSKGWYKDENLEIEIKTMALTEMQEALAAGAIDVAFNNISCVIGTHAKSPDVVYAYGFNIFDQGFALMIRPNSSLKPLSYFEKKYQDHDDAVRMCAAQLKGKTVVTTSHTDMEEAVATAAQKGGLDFAKDVHVRDFNPDEGLAAFLSGVGDAFLGGIPQRTRAVKEGMVEMLVGPDLGSPEINGYVTTKQFVQEHPNELLTLLHVWFKSVNYINNNMDDGSKVIIAKLNEQSGASFTLTDFRRFWNKIEHYPLTPQAVQKDILEPTGYSYWQNRWNDCNVYFADITKTIPAKVNPEGVFIMPAIQRRYLERYGAK